MKLLRLEQPSLNDETAFLKACNATKISDKNFAHFYEEGMAYKEWLKILARKKQGIGLEPGFGPSSFFFGWFDNDIVGRLTMRHSGDAEIIQVRGHIGYVVIPEFRNRGFATEMLRQSLPIAKGIGLNCLLVTCDTENIASQKIIENAAEFSKLPSCLPK